MTERAPCHGQGVADCQKSLAAFRAAFGVADAAGNPAAALPFAAVATYTKGRGTYMRSLLREAADIEGRATGMEEEECWQALGHLERLLRDMAEVLDRARTIDP
jgi:hypothetical protein